MTPSTVLLVPATDEARAALGNKPQIRITGFPFNIGRESRHRPLEKLKAELERRLGGTKPLNDLYLLEPPSHLLHISREHFAIDYFNDRYMLVDRASACGTLVAGKPVGANASISQTEIKNGDLIIVGTSQSPYVFRFEIESRGK
jgi:hypothetical protein